VNITIFSAGYVGAVSAACLTKLGHDVTVCDITEDKVARIGHGE